jgi:recombination protein RecR
MSVKRKESFAETPKDAFERLIAELEKLPGIGRRSAERMAYHLLEVPEPEAMALARAIHDVKKNLHPCRECGDLTEGAACPICLDGKRDGTKLCVVEWPRDLRALEKSGAYAGRYHVLMGRLSPLDGVEAGDIRSRELVERVRKNHPNEILMALSPTTEGNATAFWLAEQLRQTAPSLKIFRLARGLPSGSELSFAQAGTLADALDDRKPL